MSGLDLSTFATSSPTSSSSVACFSPTKNCSRTMLPALIVKWMSTVRDRHWETLSRLKIHWEGGLLTCRLCQSWHHENWCRFCGSSTGQGGKCGRVPGRWICQHVRNPPSYWDYLKKKKSFTRYLGHAKNNNRKRWTHCAFNSCIHNPVPLVQRCHVGQHSRCEEAHFLSLT